MLPLADDAIREHLVILQRITAQLGDALTFEQVGKVATGAIARAVGAICIGLVAGGTLVALRGVTTPDDPIAIAQMLDHLTAQYRVRAELPPELAWFAGELVAVYPLAVHDRAGTLVLGFPRTLRVEERALVDDLVLQLAHALERARMVEQLACERMRAEHASAARDQFLAMLGHELRNPLSPMLSATQLMRLRSPDQLVQERITIERNVKQMVKLVDELLDVASIARGEITLEREPSDVAEIVEQALEMVRGILDERTRIVVDVPRQLAVDVDRARIRQVIANLVINAVKHNDGQEPVQLVATARGDTVELVVRDHGKGIDPMLLPHVFDLFVQGVQAIDRAKGGLGVGLAIARSIVELHGGTIRAASSTNGSVFTVDLPRWQTERTTDQVAVPAVGGRRVLVVDDNEDAAWLLAEALRLLGHDVRTAHDGATALLLARSWSPEVALLDIGLPGMNGFDLCRALKQLATAPYAIAVSGYGQPKDREESRHAGFDAHFVKPVDLRDVQAAIDALR